VTRLDILNRLLVGHTTFHRVDDAWDLLDEDGLVAAVLCPRQNHVSIAEPAKRVPPAPDGRMIPYGEKVQVKVGDDNIDDGIDLLHRLRRSAGINS
jgi:hypothetical protein